MKSTRFAAHKRSARQGAFTLIELLVVIAIMVLLLSFTISPVQKVVEGYNLTGAGTQVAALIERARVHATTTQKVAAVRFYPDTVTKDTSEVRNVAIFEVSRSGTSATINAKQLSRTFRLNEPIVISATNSSALSNAAIVSGSGKLQNVQNLPYKEIYFYPNGTTSLSPTSPNPYFTLLSRHDSSTLNNPYVISLDPVTARVTVFRR